MRWPAALVLGLLACSRERPEAEPSAAPPAPVVPPSAPRAPQVALEDPGPALVLHGAHFQLFDEPLPGTGLRLLLGGPPYRLCTIDDLGSVGPVRCLDVKLPDGMEEAYLVSTEEDAPVLMGAYSSADRVVGHVYSTLFDPESGIARLEVPGVEPHLMRAGAFAAIGTTSSGGLELLRVLANGTVEEMALADDPRSAPFLLGDVALSGRAGRLQSVRVLEGERAFGPTTDLGPVSAWGGHIACRARDGSVAAVLYGELATTVTNVGRVDAPGPATALVVRDGRVQRSRLTLPARPHQVSCDPDGLSIVHVTTDRRRAAARRRHEVLRVRCTAAGCTESTASLEGFTAWNPPAIEIDGRIVLVHAEGADVLFRVAPLAELAAAPDKLLVHGSDDAERIDLLPRAGQAAVLVTFPDRAILVRLSPEGELTPLLPDRRLPRLAPGTPRFGGGG